MSELGRRRNFLERERDKRKREVSVVAIVRDNDNGNRRWKELGGGQI